MDSFENLPLGEFVHGDIPTPQAPPPPPVKKCPEAKCVVCEKYLGALQTDRDPLEYGLRLDRSFSHVVNAHELGKVPNAEWTNLRACYEAKNKMDDIDVRSGKPIGYVEEEERIDFLDFEGLCGAEEASSVEGGVAAAVAEEASFAEFADEAVEAGEYETL